MRRTLPGLTATAIVLGALTQPLGAQTEPVLVKGARVRVIIPASATAQQARVTGTLLRLNGDTAVLSTGAGARSRTEAFLLGDPQGRRLEQLVVNRANRGISRFSGLIIGGIAGVRIGKSIECSGLDCAGGAAVGGILGALLGFAIGNEIGTSERWRPVSTAGVRIALAPRAIGVGIRF